MAAPTIRATICPPKAPVVDGGVEKEWGEVELIMSEKGLEALNKKR